MSPREVVFQALRVFVVAVFAACAAAPRAMAAAPRTLNQPLPSFDAAAVERARDGAARRLQSPTCLQILTDFKDHEGRPLQERLDRWGVGPAEYLRMIPFLDGSSQAHCRSGKAHLLATPGTPRVLVCRQFADTQVRNPWLAESMVIHEMLHTLGLGENPPSSIEITKRVKGRCQ